MNHRNICTRITPDCTKLNNIFYCKVKVVIEKNRKCNIFICDSRLSPWEAEAGIDIKIRISEKLAVQSSRVR